MTTCKTQYELHHNFPKLADESGFTFNTHRPRIHIDWNRIRLIDIESLIKDRKFVILEQHVNDILDCVLESEFDVRILDEGVLKMFRLAQLAVEYQQFCRHYLDRSIFVLREEITSLMQELNNTKSHIREKDDEIRKLRKKSKYSYRAPLPYGNENIATMILRTLSNKDIFSSPLTNDSLQYNKCNYCDKVFMNQLYLKGHLSRRHGKIIDIPEKDTDNVQQNIPENNENVKLNKEITELKNKLKEMELLIKNNQQPPNPQSEQDIPNPNSVEEKPVTKEMKNVGVSAVDEVSVLDNIEEWKKAEQEKHNAELNLLKTQILESISSHKEKENKNKQQNNQNMEPEVVEELSATVKQQELDINALKQELNKTMQSTLQDEAESRKKIEDQISFWVAKAETQSKQYDLLLQKLNEVAKDAQESRVLADAEKQRPNQLQTLLEQSLNNVKPPETKYASKIVNKVHHRESKDCEILSKDKTDVSPKPSASKTNSRTLEQLHRKAQELLNIGSSSSSESSINITVKHDKQHLLDSHNIASGNASKISNYNGKDKPSSSKHSIVKVPKANNAMVKGKNKEKLRINKKENSPKQQNEHYHKTFVIPGSPVKIMRAKITEEVNNRLVSMGVDPLKNRIPHNMFQKQRNQLHQISERKTKGFPAREKIKNSLIAYLDTKAADLNKEHVPEYNSPNKMTKTSKLSSVFSNVKSKALSFVKPSHNVKSINKTLTLEVAKRAMTLLKTPPDSPAANKTIFKPNKRNTQRKINMSPENKTRDATKRDLSEESESESDSCDASDTNNKPKKLHNTSVRDNSADSFESLAKSSSQKVSKSLDKLIKSPARRPSSASAVSYRVAEKRDALFHASSTSDLLSTDKPSLLANDRYIDSNSEIESIIESPVKNKPAEATNIQKQTKSVLKNASSTSSLNKKKVLFDMDAIQMKSVSASPSQSTEKSDDKEKFALGIINYEGDDWDISSIEEEHLKNDEKIQVVSRTSPKIMELKDAIESQLARRRNDTPTVPVGGVDVLRGPTMMKIASFGGSNTSLGSSILDDSDVQNIPPNSKPLFKPKKVLEKEDSELDISELSIDGIGHKNDF